MKLAMKALNIANATLMALIISCFLQAGAQLFAISVVASMISEAPPRSFAILEGQYRYDSSAFWEIVPMVTFVLFVIAIAANWTTPRRWLLLLSVALFVVGGLMAGLLVEPEFASMVAAGYSDTIDPVLQSRAARWLVLDWAVWTMGLAAGLVLLIALLRPATTEKPTLDLDTAQS